jgi:hypothetical protein
MMPDEVPVRSNSQLYCRQFLVWVATPSRQFQVIEGIEFQGGRPLSFCNDLIERLWTLEVCENDFSLVETYHYLNLSAGQPCTRLSNEVLGVFAVCHLGLS